MNKILVIGGSGFIGTNLINQLVKNKNNQVLGTFFSKKKFFRNNKAKYFKLDLLSSKINKDLFNNCDEIYMCAANTSGAAVMEKDPLVHFNSNIIINTKALDLAYKNNAKKFIFISSNVVYPVSNKKVKEGDVTEKFFEKYFIAATMKMFAEKSCYIYSNKLKKKMKTLIIRPGNIYGEFDKFDLQKSHVIPALIKKFDDAKKKVEVWGDGSDIKNFIYIKDFISGCISASKSELDIVNLASEKSYSLKKVISIIDKIYKKKLIISYDQSKPTMIPKRNISISLAKKKLHFKTKYSLENGLRNTIKWYQKNKKYL